MIQIVSVSIVMFFVCVAVQMIANQRTKEIEKRNELLRSNEERTVKERLRVWEISEQRKENETKYFLDKQTQLLLAGVKQETVDELSRYFQSRQN